MYYYTSGNAYKKAKMIIDYINIVLTVVIVISFILIMFLRSKSGILFPVIFFAGGLNNALTGFKNIVDGNKVKSIILFVAAAVLLVMSAATALIMI